MIRNVFEFPMYNTYFVRKDTIGSIEEWVGERAFVNDCKIIDKLFNI